jgi:hypothetical protein
MAKSSKYLSPFEAVELMTASGLTARYIANNPRIEFRSARTDAYGTILPNMEHGHPRFRKARIMEAIDAR